MATYDGSATSRMGYAHHAQMAMHPGFHEVSQVNLPMNQILGPMPPMHNAHTPMPAFALPMSVTTPEQLAMSSIKSMIPSPAAVTAVAATAVPTMGNDLPTINVPEDLYKVLSESDTFADDDMVSCCSKCQFTNTIVDIKWKKAKTKLKCIDDFMQILAKQISFNLISGQSRSLSSGQPSLSQQSFLCPQPQPQPQSDVYNLKSNLSATAQEFRPIQAHKQTNLHHEDQLHQPSHNTAMMTSPHSPVVVTTNKDILYLSHNNNNNSNNNNNNVVHNDDSKLRAMSSNEPLLDMNDAATLESGIDSGVHDSGVSDSGVTDPAITDSTPDRYPNVDDACNVCESDSLKSEKDGKKKAKKRRQKLSKPQKSEDGSMDNLLCDDLNDSKNFDLTNPGVNSSSSTTSDAHYTVGRNNNNNNTSNMIAPRHRSGSSGKGMQQNRNHTNDVAVSATTVGSGGERPRPHLTGKPQRNTNENRRSGSRNNNYSSRDDTSMEKRNGIESDLRSIGGERNERIAQARGPRNIPGPNANRRSGGPSINDMTNNCEAGLQQQQPSTQRGPSGNRRNNANNGNGSTYPYNNSNNSKKFLNNGPVTAVGSVGNVTRSSSSSYGNNNIPEVDGNLFNAPDDFSLAHCVAEDLRMGAGIAVQFKKVFHGVGELFDQRKKVGQVAVLQRGNRFIFYLITKQFSNGKPTLGDLKRALLELRDECVRRGVKKLAMPRIGCGLDRLMWRDVREMLNEIFQPTDIEIVIYNFKEEEESLDMSLSSSSSSHPKNTSSTSASNAHKSPPVRYRSHPLVEIESWTALVVFGTTSGYMDDSCQRINAKHAFKQKYLDQCQKMSVGKVIDIRAPTEEFVFVCLIREHETAPFSFANLESCVIGLNNLLRKQHLQYVGFDFVTDPEDPIITEKIVTIFRNHIYSGVEIYVCSDPSSSRNSSNSPRFNAVARRS